MSRRIRKILAFLTVVLSLSMLISVNASAGSGNISYGGMQLSYNMDSSRLYTKLTNSYAADLSVYGELYRVSGNKKDTIECQGYSTSSKLLSFYTYPEGDYKFVKDNRNSVTVFINGNNVAAYSPQP